jgi:hypothetical protein
MKLEEIKKWLKEQFLILTNEITRIKWEKK